MLPGDTCKRNRDAPVSDAGFARNQVRELLATLCQSIHCKV